MSGKEEGDDLFEELKAAIESLNDARVVSVCDKSELFPIISECTLQAELYFALEWAKLLIGA